LRFDWLPSGVGFTAIQVAGERDRESSRPDALFKDPLAAAAVAYITEVGGADDPSPYLSTAMRRVYGDSVALRTHFLDEWILAAHNRRSLSVVALAAGMDGRSQRLPWRTPQGARATNVIDLPPGWPAARPGLCLRRGSHRGRQMISAPGWASSQARPPRVPRAGDAVSAPGDLVDLAGRFVHGPDGALSPPSQMQTSPGRRRTPGCRQPRSSRIRKQRRTSPPARLRQQRPARSARCRTRPCRRWAAPCSR
jgi:hypothetical protein